MASFGSRFKVGALWNLLLQLEDLPACLYLQFQKPRSGGLRATQPVAVNA
jgi:hypothetical protein